MRRVAGTPLGHAVHHPEELAALVAGAWVAGVGLRFWRGVRLLGGRPR